MHREKCIICNHRGRKAEEVFGNYLYLQGREHCILLCYPHSIELFKQGQTSFLLKYAEDFAQLGFDRGQGPLQPYQNYGLLFYR